MRRRRDGHPSAELPPTHEASARQAARQEILAPALVPFPTRQPSARTPGRPQPSSTREQQPKDSGWEPSPMLPHGGLFLTNVTVLSSPTMVGYADTPTPTPAITSGRISGGNSRSRLEKSQIPTSARAAVTLPIIPFDRIPSSRRVRRPCALRARLRRERKSLKVPRGLAHAQRAGWPLSVSVVCTARPPSPCRDH